jgi:hypothetical protein
LCPFWSIRSPGKWLITRTTPNFFIISQPKSGVVQLGTIKNIHIKNWISIQQGKGGMKFLICFFLSTPTTITVWKEGFPAKAGRTE